MSNQSHSQHNSLGRRKLLLKYIAFTAAMNLVWEVLQLPLYTLWSESTPSAIGFAVVHCTAGDVLIAALSLTAAVILAGSKTWPRERFLSVALLAIAFGVSYTVFSEWSNTVVTRSWSYSNLMPTIFGVGLSPLAQWIILPSVALWYVRPNLKPKDTSTEAG